MILRTEDFNFDDANVPVDIWLDELSDESEHYKDGYRYQLRASAYMPRKDSVYTGAFEVISDNKEELQLIVKNEILPFYETARNILLDMIAGKAECLYYWL